MSKYVKNKDSSDPWMIDESSQGWTLGKKATISVANEAAINILLGSDNNMIKLAGDLDASGAGSDGLRIMGDATTVEIKKSSQIKAEDGIFNASTGSRIETFGTIEATDRGIVSDGGLDLVNGGRIKADEAIALFGESSVKNLNGGVIEGDALGVRLVTLTETKLENYGKILADGLAVNISGTGDGYLMNEGRIVGDVQFGSGNDYFNNVEGKTTGQVAGGHGSDDYYIGKNKVELVENFDEGHDRVFSYANWKLGENFEEIYVLGDKNINATGNDLGNVVRGNPSDNILRGKGGHDYLEGHAGDDTLIGGSGSDYFIFREGYDRDTVADFDPAEDVLAIISLVSDFAELSSLISQHGDDTWISFGSGDRLILRGIDAADVTEDVVAFNIPM
ncbi:MAG: hypothetical protein KL863_17995 [Rhizobium sp.]|nr:hypothetical protein [Rhizobium sp.]